MELVSACVIDVVAAIDPSVAFRSAVRRLLRACQPAHFYLMELVNDMLTAARRRVSWDRRGRRVDLAWAHRLLLLCGYDTLSDHGQARRDEVLIGDDPTTEIGAA